MFILAHRGHWRKESEKNTPDALRRAMENGFGIESDIRDYMGKLVISHNIADANCQKAEEIFSWLAKFQNQRCFAINIKADGLGILLVELLKSYEISNYFTFDMSVPQMVEYDEMGIRYFTRQSEVEVEPAMYSTAAGVWIDGFWGTEWITKALLQEHASRGKQICLVSPELHNREPEEFWSRLRSFELDWGNIILCTDRPAEAATFFKEKLG